MKVQLTKIQDLDEEGWKNYFYLDKIRPIENSSADEWKEFKKDRLEQYEKAPVGFKMEECLLTYDSEAFGWLAYFLGTEYLTFIFDTKNEEIPDEVFKSTLNKLYDIVSEKGKDSAFLWSKSQSINRKLKKLGAELVEETNIELQFKLSKQFFEKYTN